MVRNFTLNSELVVIIRSAIRTTICDRWFLVGPKRSGTSVHIDPLGTSAWNTVIRGRKLWVLFPPHVDKRLVKGKDLMRDGEDDEPVRGSLFERENEHRKSFTCIQTSWSLFFAARDIAEQCT